MLVSPAPGCVPVPAPWRGLRPLLSPQAPSPGWGVMEELGGEGPPAPPGTQLSGVRLPGSDPQLCSVPPGSWAHPGHCPRLSRCRLLPQPRQQNNHFQHHYPPQTPASNFNQRSWCCFKIRGF